MPLEAALGYAQRGWPVFPCRPNKRPMVTNGFHVATHEAPQIEEWWRRWPQALIGVPTGKRSGSVVLDIDVKDPRADGFDTLAGLGLAILPETPMAHTASGGLHVYFAAIEREIRNSVGKHGLGSGLDVRGEGGYVIVPSPRSGYSWDPHWNLDTVALRPAPAWLGHRQRERLQDTHRRSLDPLKILAQACDNIRGAVDGSRHDVLNRKAYSIGGLVAAGALGKAEAWHDLEAAVAAMAWSSGGNRRKAARDLADAFRDGLAAPRRARR
jgi:bifunctional DNA primase/polymerase-like protein